MIAPTQDLRDFPAPEYRRAGVLRVLEEPGREALVACRGRVAEHTWDQTGRGLDHDKGSQLAASEHEIADGELSIDEVVGNPLVHTFVAPAEE